jgi:hypothetical protein
MEPISYATPATPNPRAVRIAARNVLGVTLVLNIALFLWTMYLLAPRDESLLAILPVIYLIPGTNVLILIISLCLIPVVRRKSGSARWDLYLLACITAPLLIPFCGYLFIIPHF